MQVSTFKHAQSVNETMEKEITRFEKIVGAFETHLATLSEDLRGDLRKNEDRNSKWRVAFEEL